MSLGGNQTKEVPQVEKERLTLGEWLNVDRSNLCCHDLIQITDGRNVQGIIVTVKSSTGIKMYHLYYKRARRERKTKELSFCPFCGTVYPIKALLDPPKQ